MSAAPEDADGKAPDGPEQVAEPEQKRPDIDREIELLAKFSNSVHFDFGIWDIFPTMPSLFHVYIFHLHYITVTYLKYI